jgi:hypothetical protein
VSWEESVRRREACPCGKGQVEVVLYSDDWGRTRDERTNLCPYCRELYVYSPRVIGGHQGNENVQGWVRRTADDATNTYRAKIERAARKRHHAAWRARIDKAPTKKALWLLLTDGGRYSPALGTFYQHSKGVPRARFGEWAEHYFTFSWLRQILAGLDVDWNALGVRDGQPCELCRSRMAAAIGGSLCVGCGYFRPTL